MNIVHDDDRDPRDLEVRAALRQVYAAPAAESYWGSLERRIMARIRAESAREWWSYFPSWVRVGLAAAAAALLVAGFAAWRTRETQEHLAYRQLLDAPVELPLLSEKLQEQPNAKTREATLRYLIRK